jgi:hypothetical protein
MACDVVVARLPRADKVPAAVSSGCEASRTCCEYKSRSWSRIARLSTDNGKSWRRATVQTSQHRRLFKRRQRILYVASPVLAYDGGRVDCRAARRVGVLTMLFS